MIIFIVFRNGKTIEKETQESWLPDSLAMFKKDGKYVAIDEIVGVDPSSVDILRFDNFGSLRSSGEIVDCYVERP